MDVFIQKIFNEHILQEACSAYEIPFQQLKPLGGFQSHVYEYPHQDQARILRITHSSHRSKEMIIGETEWMNFLSEKGIPVIRSFPNKTGDQVYTIPADKGEFYAASFSKAPGSPPSREDWKEPLFAKMGNLMGRIHAVTNEFRFSRPEIFRNDWHTEARGFAESCLPGEEETAIQKFNDLLDLFLTFPQTDQNFGLLHTDIHGGNFFVNRGSITLFDFDDCQFDFFGNDIAISIFYAAPHHCSSGEDLDYVRRFFRSFLKGYTRAHAIELDWFQYIPDFLKLREIGVFSATIAHGIENLDDWGRSYLTNRKFKIENDVPYIPLDFVELAKEFV